MSLRDDLEEAITKGFYEIYPMQGEVDHSALTEIVLKRVWETLEDVVGTAQEALFQQLTAVRTELDATRRREAALKETLADLYEKLDQRTEAEESSDA